jgi:hypothetical protein
MSLRLCRLRFYHWFIHATEINKWHCRVVILNNRFWFWRNYRFWHNDGLRFYYGFGLNNWFRVNLWLRGISSSGINIFKVNTIIKNHGLKLRERLIHQFFE